MNYIKHIISFIFFIVSSISYCQISKIAYTCDTTGNNEIFIMDPDGSNKINLTNNPADDLWPEWSPHGNKIAFSTNRDGNLELYTCDVDGSNPINLTQSSGNEEYFSWSPDGAKITFQSDRDGNSDIFIMNADGSGLFKLTSTSEDEVDPEWSPDGNYIMFSRDVTPASTTGTWQIFVISPDGSNEQRLIDDSDNHRDATFSPNGTKIAYRSTRNGNLYCGKIYLADFNVSNDTASLSNHILITDNSYRNAHPSWSLDGTMIVTTRSNCSSWSTTLWIIDVNDYSSTQVTFNATTSGPDWSPYLIDTTGLVAYYSFNGNASDESGNGNDGTLNNGVLSSSDRFGIENSAYLFDGVDDYIDCGNIEALNGISEFTFSVWINASERKSLSRIIGKEENQNSEQGIDLQLGNGGDSTFFHSNIRTGIDAGAINYNSTVQTDTWCHVALVFDGNGTENPDRLKMYVNGEYDTLTFSGTIPSITSDNTYPVWIGGIYPSSTASPWTGFIDDVRVYNRALSESEIDLLYHESEWGFIEIDLISTSTTSIGGNDGKIDLSVIYGVPPYTFSWSNGETTEDISGLTAGVYSVTVTDSRDSIAVDSVRIYDTFIDDRDNKTYKSVTIGEQVWMAENINSTKYSDDTAIPLVENTTSWVNLGIEDKAYCYYENDPSNGSIYGALYTWAAAMNGATSSSTNPSGVQGVCPSGWHLPSDEEWKLLEMHLGMNQIEVDNSDWRGSDEGGKLKEAGTVHWDSPNTGATNESGFTAFPGGYRSGGDGAFRHVGSDGYYYSSTEANSTYAWERELNYNNSGVRRNSNDYAKYDGFSVRCILDQDTLKITLNESNTSSLGGDNGSIDLTVTGGLPPFSYSWSNGSSIQDISGLSAGVYSVTITDAFGSTVTDSVRIYDTFIDIRDSTNYKAVTIGDQVWMAENVNIGIMIDVDANPSDNVQIEKYCYNNDETNCDTFGGLYQWNEMMQYNPSDDNYPGITQGVCPAGWHLPTDEEWKELEISIGMDSSVIDDNGLRGTDEAIKIMEGGTSGFEALLGGYRNRNGFFDLINSKDYFWSATESDINYPYPWNRELDIAYTQISRSTVAKEHGLSVRCIKDSDTTGLIAWYPFNGNANDESGNGNHGTVNGATLISNRYDSSNTAYYFSNFDNITTPFQGVQGNADRTITFWAKIEENEIGGYIMRYGGSPTPAATWFTIGITPDTMVHLDINNATAKYKGSKVNDGKWHHYVYEYSTSFGSSLSGLRIYQDGKLLTELLDSYNFTTYDLNTGADYPFKIGEDGGYEVQLALDDIGFYNRVLNESEIFQLYANFHPPDTLIAIADNNQVTLSWNYDTIIQPTKYYIYRDESSPVSTLYDSVIVTSISDTSFIDSNVLSGITYFYAISSVDSLENESQLSEEINITTEITAIHITFQKTFGGSQDDAGSCVLQTSDGGYIIAGSTDSFGAGDSDIYLIKTNAVGDTTWTKTIGGTGFEVAHTVIQAYDGGYIILGYTYSLGAGDSDIYLIKIDINGNVLWSKTYGGTGEEICQSIQKTTDEGYIISGFTNSYGAGLYDSYIVKTNTTGDTLWTRTYGGTSTEKGGKVQQTSDGGYIVSGYTESFGAGGRDVYLVKTDPWGDIIWTKTYGGTSNDEGQSVYQTLDGGYIISGETYSFGAGNRDIYLLKTDDTGDISWTKTYGGTLGEVGFAQPTSDGGYIIIGYTKSFGGGDSDIYLIKINTDGDTTWTKTIGETGFEDGFSIKQTFDAGFVIVGRTNSYGAGLRDVYLIKTDSLGNSECNDYSTNTTVGTTTTNIGAGGGITGNGGIINDANWIINGTTTNYSLLCVSILGDTIKLSLSSNNTSSIGGIDGSINLSVSGGYQPYEFSWSNGVTTKDISGLSAGVYSVTVTDALDSVVTDSVRIYDTFTDIRDSTTYKALTIGDQVWMAENVNIGIMIDVDANPSDNVQIEKYCYNNDETNCDTFGGLYQWEEMMQYSPSDDNSPGTTQGVCPTGWHLPTDDEWKDLEVSIGMDSSVIDDNGLRGTDEAIKIMEGGTTGFEALLGGYRNRNGFFDLINSKDYFWSATESDINYPYPWNRELDIAYTQISRSTVAKEHGLSVRCIKDSDTIGLVAWYPFNGNANDESGNGNDGIVNGPQLITDRYGNANSAYSFDGIDDYIDIPDLGSYSKDTFTISTWFYVKDVNAYRDHNITTLSSGALGVYPNSNLDRNDIALKGTIDDERDGNPGDIHHNWINSAIKCDNWYFASFTVTNDSLELYLNGIHLDNNIIISTSQHSYPYATIGAAEFDANEKGSHFDGIIDELWIHNKNLSQYEIMQLYANFYPPDLLKVTSGNQQATLTWDSTNWNYLDKVYIYCNQTLIDSVNVISNTDTIYIDSVLTNYQIYSYYIKSIDDFGNKSISSDTLQAIPYDPNPPTLLRADSSDQTVILYWDTTNFSHLDEVYIYRNNNLIDTVEIADYSDTVYVDTGLMNGTTYNYFIQSMDIRGNLSYHSNTLTATPFAVIPPPPDVTSGSACHSDSTVTLIAEGDYSILWDIDQDTTDFIHEGDSLSITFSTDLDSLDLSVLQTITLYVRQVKDNMYVSDDTIVTVTINPNPEIPDISELRIHSNDTANFEFSSVTTSVIWCGDSALTDILSSESTFHPIDIPSEGIYNYYAATLSSDGCKSLPITLTCIYDITKPEISQINNQAYYEVGSSGAQIDFIATDNYGLDSVFVIYNQITDSVNTIRIVLVETGLVDQYDTQFTDIQFDEIGIQWYGVACDSAGNCDTTSNFYILIEYPPGIPLDVDGLIFGESIRDYQIIAFPLDQDTNFKFELENAFGLYDNRKWRMFKYIYISETKEDFIEFPDFNIEIGIGYWLIIKSQGTLGLSGGMNLNDGNPKSWSLKEGWNLVGNPYRFTISWDDIMNHNGNPSEVRHIKFFSNGTYTDNLDKIRPFTGGFIKVVDRDIDLEIPLHKDKTIQSGRDAQLKEIVTPYKIESPSWYLPLRVSNGLISNEINGIGMHPVASIELDQFDDFVLPRFMEFIDINFIHDESTPLMFSKDIVPISNEYTWEFNVETNAPNKIAEMKWDPEYLLELSKNVVLVDLNNMSITDMKERSAYSFLAHESNGFKIVYGDKEYIDQEILPDNAVLGNPYPNPTSDELHIPFALPDSPYNYQVEIDIYSPTGTKIQTLVNKLYQPGVYKVRWNGNTDTGFKVSSGIYLCKFTVTTVETKQTTYKRIVMY
jgi:uncharacterized protein (TIGR02145 family)